MTEIRILSHMNKDHKLAIEDYLATHGHVDITDDISNIKLSHIELSHMIITFNHKDLEFPIEKLIPFEPSLNDLNKDARIKLVEMAKIAAEKRGFSHLQINEYRYPTIFGWIKLLLIHISLWIYLFPQILNNSLIKNKLIDEIYINWSINNSLYFEILALIIHLLEIQILFKPLFVKYRVEDYQLEWYIAAFLEGYPAYKRFNQLIKEKTH
ncbi:hypothetical protein WICMUC_003041 [Wickerhamomyces mucosus]|uniref:DUF2470 domain-containing protein n=1 Tax=Wickerhamomyces mucosus TaxID=1378264 RepID=A0A9P8TCW9_9ASCO|nr:hypothetical protein WICMUC_003041 [Wickerhamomyces mucosus]